MITRMVRRETEIEESLHGSVHVVEFVLVGEHDAAIKMALYMEENADGYFMQVRGSRFSWGQDWEPTREDAKGNEIGETTFFLEALRGEVGQSVKDARRLFREAKEAQ